MTVDLGIAQGNDAIVTETGAFDTTGADVFGHFYLWASPQSQWTMADNNHFAILSIDSSGPTSEGVIWLEDNAGTMEMGIAETIVSNANTIVFPMGQWNLVEFDIDVTNDTFDAWLNGQAFTQISGSVATITQARFGVMSEDSGTTAGVLYYDGLVIDNARTRGRRRRFPSNTYWVYQNQHAFLGKGSCTAVLNSTGTDALCSFYDTATALNGPTVPELIGIVRTATDENSAEIELSWDKGLYCEISGTAPQVFLNNIRSNWMSEGAAKNILTRQNLIRGHA
jgi:hypothetical protein